MTLRLVIGAAAFAAIATPSLAAPATSGRQFIAKAGASDLWERKEAAIMATSTNGDVAAFAKQMTVDHTKSTELVKAAAKADGIAAPAPMMSDKQKGDLAALSASKGAARDSLYVTQQKAAHADALALMQGYSSDGKAKHLRDTAGKIAPVVQSHIDMLNKMAM